MRIAALTRYDRMGASSRLRFLDFVPGLLDEGIEVTVNALLDDDYLRRLYAGRRPAAGAVLGHMLRRLAFLAGSRRFDLLWIEKELFPWLPAGIELALARLGPAYAVDFDDAWYLRYQSHANPLVRRLLGGKLDAVMRHAALVLAGNPTLAAHAERAGARRVEQVPTVADTAAYEARRHRRAGPVRIVWIGTPPNSRYLLPILPALQRVCADGRAELVLIGAGAVELPNVPLRHEGWSEAREAALLATCDIGIMPLPDTPWERGKCGFKLIQYMAAGLPVVASPVGVNSSIVHPSIGFLADGTESWGSALEGLIGSVERRADMGAAARERAETDYSLAAWTPRLARLLESLVDRPA